MTQISPLSPDRLYRACDTDRFTFATTAELEDLIEGIGQMRAIDASLGEGAELTVQWINPRGCVLLVEWGNFRALLPLAVDFDLLESKWMVSQISPLSVLLLADHCYTPSNPPEWIRALQPRLILLGVASDDKKGLPSVEVKELLRNYPHLRTDRNGWIKLTTDGKNLWVEVEKK